jgi:hypothetical protein
VIKSRIKCAGHVVEGDKKDSQNISRNFCRHATTWDVDWSQDCIHLVQNTGQWRVLVNTLRKFINYFIPTNSLHYFSVFLSLFIFRHSLCHPQGCRREFTIFNASNSLSQHKFMITEYHFSSSSWRSVIVNLCCESELDAFENCELSTAPLRMAQGMPKHM